MEAINFNDFSQKERHEIITAFLIKMRHANSMPSAESFFEYYLKKFYKVPDKLRNDIAYCQRAMKVHLSVHQTIVQVFADQPDADPLAKDSYLKQLEDTLYELNAECQYMLLRLQDDIDKFCLAFTQQQMQLNDKLIESMVSNAIVPLVCAANVNIKPYDVLERASEQELLRKYFIINREQKQHQQQLEPAPTRVLSNKDMNQQQQKHNIKDAKAVTPTQASSTVQGCQNPKSAKTMHNTHTPAGIGPAINASRLNLRAALNRARSQHLKTDEKPIDAKAAHSCQESFMKIVGLCSHKEHERITLVRTMSTTPKPKVE